MVVVQAQLSSFVKTIFRLWVMVGLLALVGANQLVAAPPIIQLSPGETTFVEPEGSDTITVAVDPGVTLSDPDNTTFTSVTVTISANYSYLHDWLSIDVPVHLEGVFTATFDSATGVLTIAPKGAPPPIAQWQEVLRLLHLDVSRERWCRNLDRQQNAPRRRHQRPTRHRGAGVIRFHRRYRRRAHRDLIQRSGCG
jgi:hypothetical protein